MKNQTLGREKIRILAVDDNPTSLRLLESVLARHDEYMMS